MKKQEPLNIDKKRDNLTNEDKRVIGAFYIMYKIQDNLFCKYEEIIKIKENNYYSKKEKRDIQFKFELRTIEETLALTNRAYSDIKTTPEFKTYLDNETYSLYFKKKPEERHPLTLSFVVAKSFIDYYKIKDLEDIVDFWYQEIVVDLKNF